MTTTTEINPETLARAKSAARTLYSFRHDMPDSDYLAEWAEDLRDMTREAKAEGRTLADDEWIDFAHAADEICDDAGLPRLFNTEGGE